MGKISRLEDDLISPSKWNALYHTMPKKCKEVVKGPPDCIGIGRNKKYGWFIMGSGQGPSLLWAEKEAADMKPTDKTLKTEELFDADPNCEHEQDENNWSGIRCKKCGGWFCY